MKKTNKYQLSQWEKADRIMMEDFNSDNAKVEAALTAHDNALAGKADISTTNALQTQVNAKADKTVTTSLQAQVNSKTAIVTGSYTGNGGKQTIYLGFAPKAVLFIARGGPTNVASIYLSYGIILPGYPMYANQNGTSSPAAAIQGDGFVVSSAETDHSANNQNTVYHYVAFR